MVLRFLLLISVILGLISCSSLGPKSPGWTVSIMAYNTENLFDAQDDADRDDETYLPLALKKKSPELRAACGAKNTGFRLEECLETDWNPEILDLKLERLKDVILQVNAGQGPDILILEEVENINVLNMLNEKLKEAKYITASLIEGPDMRGIDIGILSRFPLKQSQLHKIEFKDLKDPKDISSAKGTRGIMQADLQLPDGNIITVFGAHFPSQGNSTILRKQAVAFLNKLLKDLPEGRLAVAGGDFNITAEEDALHKYVSKDFQENWLVSHMVGCAKCQGTHFFAPKNEWSYLDMLLFSKNLDPANGSSVYRLNPKSISTPKNSKYQIDRFFKPSRFNPKSSLGVSDHLPIYGEIERIDLK